MKNNELYKCEIVYYDNHTEYDHIRNKKDICDIISINKSLIDRNYKTEDSKIIKYIRCDELNVDYHYDKDMKIINKKNK